MDCGFCSSYGMLHHVNYYCFFGIVLNTSNICTNTDYFLAKTITQHGRNATVICILLRHLQSNYNATK